MYHPCWVWTFTWLLLTARMLYVRVIGLPLASVEGTCTGPSKVMVCCSRALRPGTTSELVFVLASKMP